MFLCSHSAFNWLFQTFITRLSFDNRSKRQISMHSDNWIAYQILLLSAQWQQKEKRRSWSRAKVNHYEHRSKVVWNNIFQAITLWPSWANISFVVPCCFCWLLLLPPLYVFFFRYACGRIVNWNMGSRPNFNATQVRWSYIFTLFLCIFAFISLGKMERSDFFQSE